ncbi:MULTISPECIES: cytochrome P450 [unclassified Crossiella]|uniref:cytochrome P450 n=1 Tax=unclassified Crossiella TaxID=2620835 RepID=UPI001FFE6836|nr:MULTISPECIES: cytochrome P450 [unclassified Crossiella]MCK2238944.1 cytochrome P450 [Crossiella sp. S99.2]MCK2251486.1 cytochrome P450 [Crossiella sp. S99.1]
MTTNSVLTTVHQQFPWMRDEQPEESVRFNAKLGLWEVFTHAEIVEVLGDNENFSANTLKLVAGEEAAAEFGDGNLLQTDAPAHRQLKRLISHAFTPKTVADLEPRIAQLTHQMLDEVDGRDGFEWVAELAYPLPVTIIADLLGVPSGDKEMFRSWVDERFSGDMELSLNPEDAEAQQAIGQRQYELTAQLGAYMTEHAVERRRKPRADLLTELVQAEVDGERLTDRQIATFGCLLLLAGHITTTMMLGNTVLLLDANPEQGARVRADRSLIPLAIEEAVRMLSPFATGYRVTTAEVQVGAETIPAGQMVRLWTAAANRDPKVFTDPHRFDAGRDPNPHLAWGRGMHFCLGAPLARLEGRVVLDILFDRFPKLRADPDRPAEFMPNPETLGVRTLPLLTR